MAGVISFTINLLQHGTMIIKNKLTNPKILKSNNEVWNNTMLFKTNYDENQYNQISVEHKIMALESKMNARLNKLEKALEEIL